MCSDILRKWFSNNRFFLIVVFIFFLCTYFYSTSNLKNPKYSKLLFDMSVQLARSDKLKDAIKLAKRSIRFNPENGEAYYLLGTIALKLGNPKEAIGYFQNAIAQDLLLYEAFNEIGKYYLNNHDDEAAFRYYLQGKKSSIKRLTPSAESYFALAKILERKRDFERAFNLYFAGMEFTKENDGILNRAVELMKEVPDKTQYYKRIKVLRWRKFYELADSLEKILLKSEEG